jgi:hypothetical protein
MIAPHPDPYPVHTHHVCIQHRSAAWGGYRSCFHSPAHLWQIQVVVTTTPGRPVTFKLQSTIKEAPVASTA